MSDAQQIVFDYVAADLTREFPGVSPSVLVREFMGVAVKCIPHWAAYPPDALEEYAARLYLALETCVLSESMRRTGMRPC